jgi:transmembrane sensor
MDAAREQASLWLTKLARGLDKEDGPAFSDWLKTPANRQTIVHMAASWHGPEVIALLEQLLPEESKRTRRRKRRNMAITALALVVAVAVVVSLINALLDGRTLWSYFDGSHLPRTDLPDTIYVSGIDERRNVKLPDGSTITLSPASRVSVKYSRPWREVKLSYGAANFTVAHDPDWPFNVQAGKRDFQAMGGRFDMRVLTPELVELTVSAGTVKVQFATPRRPETDAQRSENLTYGAALVRALETARVYPGFQSIRKTAAYR